MRRATRAIVDLFYNLAMSRLAWFTPLPPVRSGIAAYSADILPLLASHHQIEAFVDPAAPAPAPDPGVPVHPSHEFVWRHDANPYALVIYQLGNATWHDYMWPYLVRFPGLVVLHDAQLHHSRSRALFASGRHEQYRQEFAFCHRDANDGVAEVVIGGRAGSLYYMWPLVGVPVACARLVAVHSPWLADHLNEEYPEQEFAVIRMGVGGEPAEGPAPDSAVRQVRGAPSPSKGGPRTPDLGVEVRARHGIPSDRVVFAAYGMLTPEKRLTEVFRALHGALAYAPNAHVMLVGQPVDWYDVEADARQLGVGERVTVTGYVPDEQLPAYLAAADVCLCLRWPTSRETSASWLRCLAAGKPTVITDLVHTSSVPAYDPRSWTAMHGSSPAVRPSDVRLVRRSSEGAEAEAERSPICVAIDIVDEQHSLGLAMRRLACDGVLRRELGEKAREYWTRHHTPQRMAEDYEMAIERALRRPTPDRSHLPAHLLADGTALTSGIVRKFGLSLETLDWGESGAGGACGSPIPDP